MLIFAAEGMLKGQLEALLSLYDAILLDGNANPAPVLLLLAPKHRQVSFLEELDLVAHVFDAECDSRSLRDALD